MPRRVSPLESRVQPINWLRAIFAGIVGSALMMSFVDIFNMMGITPFSFEVYLGGLLRGNIHGSQTWMLGVLANWVVGALFGTFYAYIFEYVLKRSNVRYGIYLGFAHAFLAAVLIFPFFGVLQQQMGTGLAERFGFFGSGMGGPTPILLFFAHLLFGASMGLFYGPVRYVRVHMNQWEPGETVLPWESGAITEEEDNPDSRIINW
jgi:hypothetical protein